MSRILILSAVPDNDLVQQVVSIPTEKIVMSATHLTINGRAIIEILRLSIRSVPVRTVALHMTN